MGYIIIFGVNDKTLNQSMEGIECLLDGVSKGTQANGIAQFDVTTRIHTYEIILPPSYYIDKSEMPFKQNIPASGNLEIPEGWTQDDPKVPFTLYFELKQDGAPPEEKTSTIAKIGAVLAPATILGIIVDSARKR